MLERRPVVDRLVMTSDSVVLAHVAAIEIARRARVRALLIKGLGANYHRIRPVVGSSDADVLVSPDGFEACVAALEACGWRERWVPGVAPRARHSVTTTHDQWPCDIDVHRQFPGFLGAEQMVFDSLWERRTSMAVAGRIVPIADRSSAILIMSLHGLRSLEQTTRHLSELRFIRDQLVPAMPEPARQELVELATALGAIDTARPVLSVLDIPLPPPAPHGSNPELDEWRAVASGRGSIIAQWIGHVSRAKGRERWRLVARMIWPSQVEFRYWHPEVQAGRWPVLWGRVRRLGRGVRGLPRVVVGFASSRQGVIDASILGER